MSSEGRGSIFDQLGLDETELEWQDLAICQGLPTNFFYDDYESNEEVAKTVDQACLSCPVMAQCMRYGVDNGEWGVWGGVYLVSGTADANRNKHKTQEIWEAIRDRITDD